MTSNLTTLIRTFPRLKVVVVGDAMLDVFLTGSSHRLCREAPVPAVDIEGRRDEPGGAANTAANARSLGASVELLAVVGGDEEGLRLRQALDRTGVDVAGMMIEYGRRTLTKQRIVADDQIMLRLDNGDTRRIDEGSEAALIRRLESAYRHCDVVIISDYGYGSVTPRLLERAASLQRRHARVLVVDAKDISRCKGLGATAVKPNYEQAVAWLKLGHAAASERVRQMAGQGRKLLDVTGAQIVALTLDSDGALAFEHGKAPYRTYARPERRTRTTGAGDTFAVALALSLASDASTAVAVELASAAAAVVVSKDVTGRCEAFELRQRLFSGDKVLADSERVEERVEYLRRQGKRIVFTNGCFDLLHPGHVAYLNGAKMLGDVLIVGVNTDDSIRRLKGPSRPIVNLQDRIEVLAALSSVDHIVAFDEDSPVELVRLVKPDLFVKGGDYTREMLPEASLVETLGGEVRILPLIPERSTSDIIASIRSSPEAQPRLHSLAEGTG